MLLAALRGSSSSVLLDVLSSSDLEAMRAAASGGDVHTELSSQSAAASSGSKRYLILTFTSEFERVHYPLPMCLAGVPGSAQQQEVLAAVCMPSTMSCAASRKSRIPLARSMFT